MKSNLTFSDVAEEQLRTLLEDLKFEEGVDESKIRVTPQSQAGKFQVEVTVQDEPKSLINQFIPFTRKA
jgi:hypothetical protein